MKIIFIFLFTMAGMFTVNFSLDLLMDADLTYALQDLLNPFWVMEPIGYLLIIALLLIALTPPLKSSFKKRKTRPNH